MKRIAIVLVPMLLISIFVIAAVTRLQSDATASRNAELQLAGLQYRANDLLNIPWEAVPGRGLSRTEAQRKLAAATQQIEGKLVELRRDGVADAQLGRAMRMLGRVDPVLVSLIDATSRNDTARSYELARVAQGLDRQAVEALEAAGARYHAHADDALSRALVRSTAVIALLFVAFAIFLCRAVKARGVAEGLVRENHDLLATTREQATTDALTGLANRRALSADLATALEIATPDDPVVLALFDLDGFKGYNDTFGHPAGDALLNRLGHRLTTTVQGLGTGYRIGGDEFCVLAQGAAGESIVRLAAAALSDEGEGFQIGCSYGTVHLPTEADSPEAALGLADQRMYGQKSSGRASASRQSIDVLVRVLGERSADLHDHRNDVARLAALTAQRLGVPEQEIQTIQQAGELHDIGKVAIPDAILSKRGTLTDAEWAFIHRHTIIGERIVLAAPSLAHTAKVIRATHERVDGAGYPDGLSGDEIPFGSRVIAVCDAFDAMVSDRPHQPARSAQEAVAELRRCAGSQFDAEIVEVMATLVAEGLAQPGSSSRA